MTSEFTPGRYERPPIWVGHVGPLYVSDLDEAVAFYQRLGLRPAARTDQIASMEMRGGTHLVLKPGERSDRALGQHDVPFDLMVDDIELAHRSFTDDGLDVSAVQKSGNHWRFTVDDPFGHRIKVHSTHVVGTV